VDRRRTSSSVRRRSDDRRSAASIEQVLPLRRGPLVSLPHGLRSAGLVPSPSPNDDYLLLATWAGRACALRDDLEPGYFAGRVGRSTSGKHEGRSTSRRSVRIQHFVLAPRASSPRVRRLEQRARAQAKPRIRSASSGLVNAKRCSSLIDRARSPGCADDGGRVRAPERSRSGRRTSGGDALEAAQHFASTAGLQAHDGSSGRKELLASCGARTGPQHGRGTDPFFLNFFYYFIFFLPRFQEGRMGIPCHAPQVGVKPHPVRRSDAARRQEVV
jgi:hypothetical protein